MSRLQTFAATAAPGQGPPRLAALREVMAREGLDGFLVPRADAHQGEYVAPRDERLAWLTGFTGSAGLAVVLAQSAGLFVDGRYRVQARAQTAPDAVAVLDWPAVRPGAWIAAALPQGGTVGFDPWLHTPDEIARLHEAAAGAPVVFRPVANLVDAIWHDQPPPPLGAVVAHPAALAGEAPATKRAWLAEGLARAGQRAAVLTLPDSVAWLLNLRGSDVARNPVVHAFAVLHDDARLVLFIDRAKLGNAPEALLDPGVTVAAPADFAAALAALEGPVRLDPRTAPLQVETALRVAGVDIAHGDDPCLMPKARKNAAELAGMREAQLRDGAAMAAFLAWLDAEAPAGRLTEIAVVEALEDFRAATGCLRDLSFETIAGAGPNGAIVHYRVTEATNRRIVPGDLLLVDSGAQYPDGTTDVTRTLATGPVPGEAAAAFTRVLKGMIAISRARWPKGLAGRDLDPLARYHLWLAGQDYDHGTGHGVGAALSVHEGPARLSRLGEVALEPGMILSNEPGYYREGAFGIRTENLLAVIPAPALAGADDRPMLAFETLTFVPIDRRLILPGLLAPEERAWLDGYHAEVRARIAPRLAPAVAGWLQAATAPL
ncbi:MAG: M24 family metallopeptidase [Rhodobacteraceae bacterium]|nr:M24 family metallopeptidase [Paracoccaceae bacterium]